ncbi:peptide transporter family 1-like [Anthonomus grandis grandis]|uniref:peptide transporter family 1-like n=1 Tax=Anthonomus grandis grandis TaxID=2921223 RepID=UPI0021661037|nr:peptide transporter family 1-like [Anthonomus grandis grandis]
MDPPRHSVRRSNTSVPLPFPRAVIWVVICILLENVAFFCLAGTLSNYFKKDLMGTSGEIKTVFYIFILLTYAFALLGGWMADACFNRKFTIIFAFCLSALSFMSITICSKNYEVGKTHNVQIFAMRKTLQYCLFLAISFASGILRPNIITFAADQLSLPEQEVPFGRIIAAIYFFFKLKDLGYEVNSITCVLKNQCNIGFFATLTVFICLSFIIFMWNLGECRKRRVESGFVWSLGSSIFYAVHSRITKPNRVYNHWLDRSRHSYGGRIVRYAKRTIRMLVIFLILSPFYMFFHLSERWPQSSYRMSFKWRGSNINTSIMPAVKAGITLLLIPVFHCFIYPVFSRKVRLLRRPLRRMICGGFIAALAFIISACLYLIVEYYEPRLPAVGEAHLRIYDSTDCEYRFWSSNPNIPSNTDIHEYYVNQRIKASLIPKETNFTFKSNRSCKEKNFTVDIQQKRAFGLFLTDNDINVFIDFVSKSKDGKPLLRTIISNENYDIVEYRHTVKPNVTQFNIVGDIVKFSEVGIYKVTLFPWSRIHLEMGATYTILINVKQRKIRPIIVTDPNKVHILWQIPQYVVIGIADVMFWISGFEFAYSEAPNSSKAMMLGMFIFFSYFIGTGLSIFIQETSLLFQKESINCFVFASLLLVTAVIFAFLAHNYKHNDDDDEY